MPLVSRSVLGSVFFCFLWAASVPEIPQRVGHACLTLISSQVRAEMFISVNRVIPISREEMTHWVRLLSALEAAFAELKMILSTVVVSR